MDCMALFKDKKGIVFTRPRDTVSFFLGLLIVAFGLLPLLTVDFKVLSWSLPAFITSLPVEVIIWVAAVAGLYVVIDGFVEPPAHSLHWFLIIAGFVMFVIGLLPILASRGIIGLSFSFFQSTLLYHIVISFEGLLLMTGGLTEH